MIKDNLVKKKKTLTHLRNLMTNTLSTGVRRNHDNFLHNTTNRIKEDNRYVEIHLMQLFSKVGKKHSEKEMDRLLISGTQTTTPSLAKISTAPIEPWLFSRAFMLLGLSFGLLTLLLLGFGTDKAAPGMDFIGSLTVPFTLVTLFFEINIYRNISIIRTITVFLIGGIASLVMTMVLYDIVPSGNGTSLSSAFLVGFIEEAAKVLIIAYFINRLKLNYIFNGMLIGAAVGAGFTVFETAGYIGEYGLLTIFVRSWQSVGTHTIWGAIIGAAIILGKTRHHHFTFLDGILDFKFLEYFVLVITLHAMWDWNISGTILDHFYLQKLILIAIGWITIFLLMDAGLREVRTLQGQKIMHYRHSKKRRRHRK